MSFHFLYWFRKVIIFPVCRKDRFTSFGLAVVLPPSSPSLCWLVGVVASDSGCPTEEIEAASSGRDEVEPGERVVDSVCCSPSLALSWDSGCGVVELVSVSSSPLSCLESPLSGVTGSSPLKVKILFRKINSTLRTFISGRFHCRLFRRLGRAFNSRNSGGRCAWAFFARAFDLMVNSWKFLEVFRDRKEKVPVEEVSDCCVVLSPVCSWPVSEMNKVN